MVMGKKTIQGIKEMIIPRLGYGIDFYIVVGNFRDIQQFVIQACDLVLLFPVKKICNNEKGDEQVDRRIEDQKTVSEFVSFPKHASA